MARNRRRVRRQAAARGHAILVVPAGYAATPALHKHLPYERAGIKGTL